MERSWKDKPARRLSLAPLMDPRSRLFTVAIRIPALPSEKWTRGGWGRMEELSFMLYPHVPTRLTENKLIGSQHHHGWRRPQPERGHGGAAQPHA